MRFRVIVLPSAESDIAYAADWIAEYSFIAAARWLEGIHAAINTLSEIPRRCPVAGDDFGRDVIVRQLFYGRAAIGTASCSRLPKARCTSCACGMERAHQSASRRDA
jgi:plasmid stabilization system protein ParE